MANTLLIRLDGAMQSWGERGRWGVRDSASEPTKSGVVGLVACALGWAEDAQLRFLSDSITMGVRCDSLGQRITDYHTIGGGYDAPALIANNGKPKKTPKGEPHTEQSWRDYLCDASFLVALRSDDEQLIEQMATAVQDPVWPVFLGRKSCHPSRPIYEDVGDFETLVESLQFVALTLADLHHTSSHSITEQSLRFVVETAVGQGTERRDNVLSRSNRRYAPRYVDETMETVAVETPKEAGS